MPDLPVTHLEPMLLTLQAVSRRYPGIYEKRVKEKISTLLEFIERDRLPNFFRLLDADPQCWQWLDEPTRISLKAVIQSNINQSDILISTFGAIAVKDLKPFIVEAFEKLSEEAQINVIKSNPRPEFAARAIAIYSGAASYRRAENLGESLILPMASYFSPQDVKKVLEAAQKNNQIYSAGGTPAILDEFFEKTKQHLPYIHESWKAFFSSLLSTRYYRQLVEETELDFWSDSVWEDLVNRLRLAGVRVPPTQELDD